MCVLELGSACPEDPDVRDVVERVLHRHFGIGGVATTARDALLSAAGALASEALADADSSLAPSSVNWMSAFVADRQCAHLPLCSGQTFGAPDASHPAGYRRFRVHTTSPSGPVYVGPSTVVVYQGYMVVADAA